MKDDKYLNRWPKFLDLEDWQNEWNKIIIENKNNQEEKMVNRKAKSARKNESKTILSEKKSKQSSNKQGKENGDVQIKPIILNCYRCSLCLTIQGSTSELEYMPCECKLPICHDCAKLIAEGNGKCPFCEHQFK